MFFDARQRELADQCDALRARSALLRARAAQDAQVLAPPLRVADGAWTTWRWVRQHRELVIAVVVVVAIVRPRGARMLVRLTWRGWRAWRWWRALAEQVQPAWAGHGLPR